MIFQYDLEPVLVQWTLIDLKAILKSILYFTLYIHKMFARYLYYLFVMVYFLKSAILSTLQF